MTEEKNPLGIICVCLAENKNLKETASYQTYPKDIDLKKTFNGQNVQEIFFPEGCLSYPEDKNVVFLEYKDETLYGFVFIDEKNSIHQSLIIFAQKPLFTIFEPLARICMRKIMDKKDEEAKCIEELFQVVENYDVKEGNIILDDEVVPVELTKLEKDEYPGVDLIYLVQNFGVETMIIWYALLLEKRVIFCGQPAQHIMNFCLAAPRLVKPLNGFSRNMYPFLSMSNLDPLDSKTIIAGLQSKSIEGKNDLYDCCASLFQKKVLNSVQIKIETADLLFIENVLLGIKSGQNNQWVMSKFQEYTEKFCTSVLFNNFFSNHHNLISGEFIRTLYYENMIYDLSQSIQFLHQKFNVYRKAKQMKELEPLEEGDSATILIKNFNLLQYDDVKQHLDPEEAQKYDFCSKLLTNHSDDTFKIFSGNKIVKRDSSKDTKSSGLKIDLTPKTSLGKGILNLFSGLIKKEDRRKSTEEKPTVIIEDKKKFDDNIELEDPTVKPTIIEQKSKSQSFEKDELDLPPEATNPLVSPRNLSQNKEMDEKTQKLREKAQSKSKISRSNLHK